MPSGAQPLDRHVRREAVELPRQAWAPSDAMKSDAEPENAEFAAVETLSTRGPKRRGKEFVRAADIKVVCDAAAAAASRGSSLQLRSS
jgi:hypothetical protein